MDESDKIEVPVLEDIVIQGNEIPKSLDKSEIEAIVQVAVATAVQSAVAQAVEDICKAHIDEILPSLIEQALDSDKVK